MEQHALGQVTWVELDEPTVADLATIRDRFGFPSLLVEVALRHHHRPRLERHAEHLLLVLKPATYVDPDEVIESAQLVVLAGPDTVVTVATGYREQLRDVREDLSADPARVAVGPAAVVHAITDRVVDGYAAVLDGLETDVDEIEIQVFSPTRGSHAERIYRLKSEVQEFRRAVGPLPDELEELVAPAVDPAWLARLDAGFRDVRIKAARAAEHVGHLDELLSSVLSAHLAQIGIQQNSDMRRISAWVAIVAAPTAMASIYGMNFAYMPELEWRYGYFAVLVAMAVVCIVLYRLFRRSGWL